MKYQPLDAEQEPIQTSTTAQPTEEQRASDAPDSVFMPPDSLLEPETTKPIASQHALYVFDTCQVGMTLRVVVFLELFLATAALFMVVDAMSWLLRFAYWTAAVLPAAVVWLLVVCAAKKWLQRRSEFVQWALCLELGAACGVLACAMLTLGDTVRLAVWGASASAGMLLATMMVTLLKLRASIATPATAAARLSQLQSRIRPHFLFNTINSAIALIRIEPKKAEAVLTDLSTLFRGVLQDQGSSVALTQELDLARRYLDIEKVRFDERLQVQWDVQVDTDSVYLPVLTLQPLVENAVKHAVECSTQRIDVWVRCLKRSGYIRIEVQNTLANTSKLEQQRTVGNGIALRNVRERLQLMYDLESEFKAGLREDGTFLVRMELPVKKL